MKYHFSFLLFLLSLLLSCQEQKSAPVVEKPSMLMFTILRGDQTHLKFKNKIPENERMNSLSYEYYYNGGGVSVGDVNADGLPDIYLTGNVTPNKLYLNQGNFKFKDMTNVSGLKDTPSWTTGSTMVDINNDGILDIYVCRSGKLPVDQRRNQFFVSQGTQDGHPIYTNQAKKYGLDDGSYSTQAVFFDYDRDGDLDMYLLNHNVEVKPFYDVKTLKKQRDLFVGDKLYQNVNGHFEDVSEQAGIIGNVIGYGLGVSVGDLNNDGWADIYVANDYSEHDYLYYNDQKGGFVEASAVAFGQMSNYSMGTDIADFNNDGLLDIISLDMVAEDNYGIKTSMSGMNPERFQTHLDNGLQHQYMYNALQLNRGNQVFSEVGQITGVHSTDWSWAPLFLDIDLDGLKDLFVTNGLKRDFRNNDYRNYKTKRLEAAEKDPKVNRKALIKELIAFTPQKKSVNYVFQNKGDLQFENKQKSWGINAPSYSNGLAYADFDNDGDLDLITNNIDESPFIYKNNARQMTGNNYLKIKFEGAAANVDGIGTRVILTHRKNVQVQEHFLTRGYQSSVDRGLVFGLGDIQVVELLQIKWSDGKEQTIENIDVNQTLVLHYKEANLMDAKSITAKDFATDVTDQFQLNFRHEESNYDDYQRESLLPHKMSELGPGLAVADVNNDGLDDVYIGGAAGQAGQLFLQAKVGLFAKSEQVAWQKHQASEDLSALFFDANGDGWADLYIVSGSNEFEDESPLKDRLYINHNGQFIDASQQLPDLYSSGYAVAANDFDLDGDLDLFVGGRQRAGMYPYPVSSYMLRNDGGKFTDVTAEIAPAMRDLGRVTDAVWADYNGDQHVDLLVVGEWMPLTVFTNSDGVFTKEQIAGTQHSTGWWNCIVSADFDQDGDLDFMLGNNGLNYKYKASQTRPFSIYAADFDQNGTHDIVLGYWNGGNEFPLRGRQCSSNQMPFIKKKFPTYHDFGSATLTEVYDDKKLQAALQYHVEIFASSYVENKGKEGFELTALPRMAQLSAINQIVVLDVNHDGYLDVITAGNKYESEVETPRNDASYGLILLGDGKGKFSVLASEKSNLYLKGDVKDLALINLASGTVGLIAAKNDDYLQLVQLDSL